MVKSFGKSRITTAAKWRHDEPGDDGGGRSQQPRLYGRRRAHRALQQADRFEPLILPATSTSSTLIIVRSGKVTAPSTSHRRLAGLTIAGVPSYASLAMQTDRRGLLVSASPMAWPSMQLVIFTWGDTLTNIVRKIDTSGNVTTFAGRPQTSGSVEGTGLLAEFSLRSAWAVDRIGSSMCRCRNQLHNPENWNSRFVKDHRWNGGAARAAGRNR